MSMSHSQTHVHKNAHKHSGSSNLFFDGGEDGGGGFRLGAVSVGGIEDGAQHGGSSGSVRRHLRHWHSSWKTQQHATLLLPATLTCHRRGWAAVTPTYALELAGNTDTVSTQKEEVETEYQPKQLDFYISNWCILLLFKPYLHFDSDLFMFRVMECCSFSQHAFGKGHWHIPDRCASTLCNMKSGPERRRSADFRAARNRTGASMWIKVLTD